MDLCSVNVEKLKLLNLRQKKYDIRLVGEGSDGEYHERLYLSRVGDKIIDIMMYSKHEDFESIECDLEYLQEEMKKKYG